MSLKFFLKKIFTLMFRIEVIGTFSNTSDTKKIITPNHVSLLDGILLGLFLPIEPVFAIYSPYIEKAPLKWLKSRMKFLPVEPTNPFAIKQMIKEVDSGVPLVIFPEGRISLTGSLMKVFDGAGFIAAKTNADIIPVRIEGAEFSFFSYLKGLVKLQIFPKITIHILPAERLDMPLLGTGAQKRAILGDQLHRIMMNAKVDARKAQTIWEAYIQAACNYGMSTKIIEDINFIEESYRTLTKKSLALSRIFDKCSAKKETLGLLLPNATVMGAAILGANLSSRVCALLNYTAGAKGINSAVIASEIKTIITSRSFIEKGNLENLILDVKSVNWIFLEDFKDRLTLTDKVWIGIRTYFPNLVKQSVEPDSPAVNLYTSGSEGNPKGVVHSNSSILANIEQIKAVADFTPKDKFMSCLPLFHAFGLTAGLLAPLYCGSRLFLYPSPLHYRIIPELIYDKQCTVLFGTSTFLEKYAKFGHPYDFVKLRYVVAGAEKLSQQTKLLWQNKFGIRILEGYGVTECAPVISINVPMAVKEGTVGRALPRIETRLIPVPGIDNAGVLQVKGPNVMQGYLKVEKPGMLEPTGAYNANGQFESGWYDTGDIVSIDDDGYCSILGRMKRFAKIAGEMVALESIENLALAINKEAQHAAVTRKDEQKGEAVVLFTTDKSLNREKLREQAKIIGMPEISVPRLICYIESIPLLGSGKTDFVTLTQLALEV
ncbi:bifunctional acyl-ACP--phospholipid O-acyltransferase/long-chain-fatty-acid--ACP ligase [Thorsellia anophelis]|uniref:Acyl-[acyl-carrier-protein]-phospholipid O-acyltransferase / long-chain-fatty-acid--[acyl-carrier-protein] ligase n=1 Tax=Thorsellia anophelis DSM 18579 TaxID=1123402 RepID=A0A1I0BR69_9GAMM|nr:bifunctional acyl-ACP--phospholipid O-acyltransferase/long-chain-fatty-acid--ACP ligase [Thorsellia anophelis]SET09444.1 acyl-[acyl-carrier-protein]-phospholipid O-acyltransferase / long-chain-fatty-acid--[acyl-carrier-protein] ligase [Thorsellia anophelis DSM 18579]